MAFSPRVIALLGFGEAGSAIAQGLAIEGGWRGTPKPGDNAPRRLIAIDTALDKDARGSALGKAARALDIPISDRYTEVLGEADLVICAVQGEHALEAAAAAGPLLKAGAHFLDLCTVTGRMSDEDRAEIEKGAGRYIDVAVMGGFFKQGIKAPMLVAGEDAAGAVAWMNTNGFAAKLLGPKPGSASSVKMLRSTLIKGVEALGVEALVTAKRQGILEEVLGCLADADQMPLGGNGPGRQDLARNRRRSPDDRGHRAHPPPHGRCRHRPGRRPGAEPRRCPHDSVREGDSWRLTSSIGSSRC